MTPEEFTRKWLQQLWECKGPQVERSVRDDFAAAISAAVEAEREALLPPLVELYDILEGDDDPSEERIQTACDAALAAIRARAGEVGQ